jgi:hypothetical protein
MFQRNLLDLAFAMASFSWSFSDAIAFNDSFVCFKSDLGSML